jgi:hypothetical protein
MKVSGQVHFPADLPPGKQPPPLEGDCLGPELVWGL